VYLFGVRCKCFAYGPADATAIPSGSRCLVYLFGAGYPGIPGKEVVKPFLNHVVHCFFITLMIKLTVL